jgi:hypothetical protein
MYTSDALYGTQPKCQHRSHDVCVTVAVQNRFMFSYCGVGTPYMWQHHARHIDSRLWCVLPVFFPSCHRRSTIPVLIHSCVDGCHTQPAAQRYTTAVTQRTLDVAESPLPTIGNPKGMNPQRQTFKHAHQVSVDTDYELLTPLIVRSGPQRIPSSHTSTLSDHHF